MSYHYPVDEGDENDMQAMFEAFRSYRADAARVAEERRLVDERRMAETQAVSRTNLHQATNVEQEHFTHSTPTPTFPQGLGGPPARLPPRRTPLTPLGSYHGFSSGMQPNPIGAHRVDMVHGTITGPSGLSTPSSGTLVLTGGERRSFEERQGMRNVQLFPQTQKPRSANRKRSSTGTLDHDRGGNDVDEDEYDVEFIFLDTTKPSQKPASDLALVHLNAGGFGTQTCRISRLDTCEEVNRKIRSKFPILQHIIGGIEMFKQKGPGVSKALTPMISRILPGSELAKFKVSQKKKVYIARIVDGPIPGAFILTGVTDLCSICQKRFDLAVLEDHMLICPGRKRPAADASEEDSVLNVSSSMDEDFVSPSSSSSMPKRTRTSKRQQEEQDAAFARQLNKEMEDEDLALTQNEPEELNRLIPDSSRQIEVETRATLLKWFANREKIYEETHTDLGVLNRLEVNRPTMRQDAFAAVLRPAFMDKILNPLDLTLKGENIAIDTGGVSRHFFSIVMEECARIFPGVHGSYTKAIKDNDFASIFGRGQELLAIGILAGMAAFQQSLFAPFVGRWLPHMLENYPKHPFLDGLKPFGIVNLIAKEKSILRLFDAIPWTFKLIRGMLVHTPADHSLIEDDAARELAKLKDTMTFQFFVEFLRRVDDGVIQTASGTANLKQVFQFATGSFMVIRTLEDFNIFIVTADLEPLPADKPDDAPLRRLHTVSAQTCAFTLTLPVVDSIEEMERIMIHALDDSIIFSRR